MHRFKLYGAGALVVHESVLESRVGPLVSQEVVRQLDVDLFRTHYDHFVEKTDRHLNVQSWLKRFTMQKGMMRYQPVRAPPHLQ